LSINLLINNSKLIFRLVIIFKYIVKLINLYSLSFFFLIKNYKFLYSLLKYFNTLLLSYSLSIFIISNNNSFKYRKFTIYYTLYLIVFIIININNLAI
jgi:hypothetical protein